MISKEKNFFSLNDPSNIIQKAVMPIVAFADGQCVPLGTGFVIAERGLMMTAKHNIEELIAGKMKKRDGEGYYEKIEKIYAVYLTNDLQKDNTFIGGLWPIHNAAFAAETDIAFLQLVPLLRNKQLYKLPTLTLSPGLPKEGEKIFGFGYYQIKTQVSKEELADTDTLKYFHRNAFTKGKIIEVHPEKRDSVMLPYPSIHVNARFEGGMSGGPIFNGSGNVVGVICSSYDQIEGQLGYSSYASLIWPTLGTPIKISVRNGFEIINSVNPYQLIQMGYVKSDETINNVSVQKVTDKISDIRILDK